MQPSEISIETMIDEQIEKITQQRREYERSMDEHLDDYMEILKREELWSWCQFYSGGIDVEPKRSMNWSSYEATVRDIKNLLK